MILALAFAFTLSPAKPSATTPTKAAKFLELNGYKMSFDDQKTSGMLSVGRDRVSVIFGESYEYGKTYGKPLHTWTCMSLDANFLVPHPINRDGVESWFRSLDLGQCRLLAGVDDVVTLHDEWIEFNGKTDVLARLAGFYRAYRGLKGHFRAD